MEKYDYFVYPVDAFWNPGALVPNLYVDTRIRPPLGTMGPNEPDC